MIVYLTTYNRVQNEIEKRLREIPAGVSENIRLWQGIQDISDVFGLGSEIVSADGGVIVGGSVDFPIDYSKTFVANISPKGQITVFSLIEMSDREYFGAVQLALAGGNARGPLLIRGESWHYKVGTTTLMETSGVEEYQTSVVFLNTDEESGRLKGLALSLLIIGLSAIAVILYLSYFLANRAMVPVQANMDRQRRFVADASHELKTPLAVITMNGEAAKGTTDIREITENMANIEAAATRMDSLVRNLLTLAREEETKPVVSAFDLSAVMEEEAGRVEAILFEKDIRFVFEKPEAPLIVKTDREKLKMAVDILFDNAVKYTPAGGFVSVIIRPAAGKAKPQIIVKNTGAYLSLEDRSRIFDRFYRADKSRNSGTGGHGGHGIGLAIAKETIHGLGGQIRAESVLIEDGTAVNQFIISL
ncbi:histidine kinase [Clostridia bacterium]|nr:histidine kinase [Clostridia bacterium]